jgi:hypothetical protein
MRLKALLKGRRLAVVGASLTLGGLSLAAIALADNVVNDVAANPGSDTIAAGGSTSVGYKVVATGNAQGDPEPGCNASDGTSAVLTVTAPAQVTVSGSPLTFTACNSFQNVTLSSSTPGDYPISVSVQDSGTGSYATNPASFTLHVTGVTPPSNQSPVVDTAAADADGTEGDTLSSSGSFTDPDGDPLTITADNTEGTFTDNHDGTWSWSLPTTDDVAGGTITVTADDGNGGTVQDDFHYSAANANPTIDNLAAGGTNCDPTVGFDVNDVGTADTESGTVDWGDSSIDDTFAGNAGDSFGPFSHHYGSAGTYTVTVNAADDDGGNATAATTSHTVNNIPSAILQPINYTGPRSAFKAGSTIPVKITVANCNGSSVGNLAPQVAVYKVNVAPDPDGTTNEALSTVPPTSGTTMRYDATGAQYIYNLATKGLSAPSDYKVVIHDGSFASDVVAYITLKK